ncbi:SDR family oxidoreductase [Amycolatopsis sp. YIM 10]|uniref:SDR family oxidoreductase n=1 Tax=Amycolatopsis sp. YIM 10 TaxID=2653857 RepID=UPI0012907D84|nr:SDR family oxidoreductase [Amycolatopsis sp. YIM 10]
MRCLVTGATGYIGGRLVPGLLAAGYSVRCLVRDPSKLRDVPWAGEVEIVRGDVLDADSLHAATEGVDVLYYLVHSLSQKGFAGIDRQAALLTAEAARDNGVGRIVYLGGLKPEGEELSDHLASRAEVGEIFLRSGVPTAVLRAAIILGSGSASFEMLRYLTERLPVMVVPKWAHNRVQPIAIRDVLRYLTGCAELPSGVNRAFDIGGPDVLTYQEMMRRYAVVSGLIRRVMVPAPVLTPRLSSHWVNLVTPVPRGIARPLIDSLVHEMVCREHDIERYVPAPPEGLVSYEQAVELALARIRDAEVPTHWAGASVPDAPAEPLPSDPEWTGGSVYTDHRRSPCAASPEALWRVVEGVGGSNGWYSFPLAWAVRGWLDRLVGGVGLRRGRRDQQRLHLGEALDWWRVEAIERGELLRLRAEMKVPGQAWLELAVEAVDSSESSESGSTYRQRAVFVPKGLAGHLYWWSVAPFHGLVFGGMVRNIVRTAERPKE